MTDLTGEHFIGFSRSASAEKFVALNPARNDALAPPFSAADEADVAKACALASQAAPAFESISAEQRAEFMEATADNIVALDETLLERAHAETGLPLARLTGERGRTVGQLKLLAAEARDAAWMSLRFDPAMPERKPLARSDLRARKKALGPVAIFGASNFPLAFSVAGGDTAAAFAAGCPVVVKAHPAHPGTSELVAGAIVAAAKSTGMPEGVFSMLQGPSDALGAALVADPRIKAVGFTGSRNGGFALMKIAADRKEPIPVYAEMSAVNPVLLMPGALANRAEELGREYVGSLTMGAGQFCTNPGLILACPGSDLDRFISSAKKVLQESTPQTMLTSGIYEAYQKGVDAMAAEKSVATIVKNAPDGINTCAPALFSVSGADFLADGGLAREIFGATSLIVQCKDGNELRAVAQSLEGQLTVTLMLDDADIDAAALLIPLLEDKAGRLIVNGWPTGVEVCHAMVHGGPFPATSDGRSTSVGTLAIDRFLRPVCYQDFPAALLPEALRDSETAQTIRRAAGKWRV